MRFTRAVPLVVLGLGLGLVAGWSAPVAAQTLVFGAQGEPVSLDTAIIEDGISQKITSQIYTTLVKY